MTVAGDLVTKVIASIVTDGLRRGYHELKTAVRRRQVIDRAISGAPQNGDDRPKKAIRDLQKVIGNAKGELTEPVAAFIREIERSAIPEALIKCVLTNGDPTLFYPAFETIYHAFSPEIQFQPKTFFAAFYEAIKLRAQADVKDAGLLEFIQAQNKNLAKQLRDIAKALSAIGKQGEPLTAAQIAEARIRLARSFEAANRYLTVETLQGAKRCRIKQLVVPPRLANTTIPKAERLKGGPQSDEIKHTTYLQFRTTVSRAVILGDPGGGKSTLTQLLCFDNSNSIILESNFPGKPQIDPAELRIPFRIVLRGYDKRKQAAPAYSFFDYLVDNTKELFEGDKNYTAKILRHFLYLGSAILIFDGLDEILEVEARRQMVSLIEEFCHIYAGCPVIVTSRLVGYRDAPVSDEFSTFHLASFNGDEVASFALKFIKVIEGLKVIDAKTKADRFVRQTNNIAQDLRENPLMLGLMVYLFIYRGDVPSNRPEIYKECATLMFERWDQRRDIIFNIPSDFDLLNLFSHLASRIFGSAETEEGVSRDWLTSELRTFFEDWYLDKAKALHAARSLVDFITGRAWVMVEVGPNVFKFTHRTFLEYFFARHLLSSSESVSVLIKARLFQKIIKSEWDMISHLALQTAVFRDAGKMMQAADTMGAILRDASLAPKQEIAFLSFAAKAMEYLLIPEAKYRNLVKDICQMICKLGAESDVGAITVLVILIRNTSQRAALAKEAIYEVFREKLKQAGTPERSFVMFSITRERDPYFRYYFSEAPTSYWQLATTNGSYFSELRREFERFNHLRALDDAYEAKLYMFTYGEHHRELFRRHGIAALLSAARHLVVTEMPDPLLEALQQFLGVQRHHRSTFYPDSSSDIATLIIDLSTEIEKVGQLTLATKTRLDRTNSEQFLNSILRGIYHVLVEMKQKPSDNDLYARALLVFAFFVDIFETTAVDQKRKTNKEARLLNFMPSEAMKELFGAIGKTPLSSLLWKWNKGQVAIGAIDYGAA